MNTVFSYSPGRYLTVEVTCCSISQLAEENIKDVGDIVGASLAFAAFAEFCRTIDITTLLSIGLLVNFIPHFVVRFVSFFSSIVISC